MVVGLFTSCGFLKLPGYLSILGDSLPVGLLGLLTIHESAPDLVKRVPGLRVWTKREEHPFKPPAQGVSTLVGPREAGLHCYGPLQDSSE